MLGKKKPPTPSADELALIQQRKDLMSQQQGLLAQAQAQIKRPPSEAEIRAEAIQKQYDDRLQAALRGDIPLDPNLERGIAEDKAAMETYLSRALGPNFAASTPGQMGLGRFNEDVAGRRFGAREAFIAGTEAPSFNRYSLGQNLGQQEFQRPLQVSQGYGGALGEIDPLLSFYTNERTTPFNVAEQRRAQTLQGLGQLAGAGANFYTQGFALPGAIKSSGGTYPSRSLGNPQYSYGPQGRY